MKKIMFFALTLVFLSTLSTPFSVSAAALGDVNSDCVIDNLDAVWILRHDAGLIELSNEELSVADVNSDFFVNNLDAIDILKFDAGLIDSFTGNICKHANTTVINLVDATVEADGYSGDVICNDCQSVVTTGVVLEKFDYVPKPITYLTYTKSNGASITLPSGVDILQYTLKRANKSAVSVYPDIEAEILTLINEERVKEGIAPLENQSNAYYYSKVRADECVESFSHTRPNGTGCFSVFDDGEVFYKHVGENLFYCAGHSLSKVAKLSVESWMNSEGHRNNILNGSFKTTTISVVFIEETRTFYAVQLFMA